MALSLDDQVDVPAPKLRKNLGKTTHADGRKTERSGLSSSGLFGEEGTHFNE
jgi:hypothetical protein